MWKDFMMPGVYSNKLDLLFHKTTGNNLLFVLVLCWEKRGMLPHGNMRDIASWCHLYSCLRMSIAASMHRTTRELTIKEGNKAKTKSIAITQRKEQA
jgi:NAD(P)H-dependent FMN reductase